MRKVALLILYDENHHVLLQHRDKDAKRLPDHWGFFGGGIEEGETPEITVRRELVEELEYKPINPEFLFGSSLEGGEPTHYVFVERYDIDQELIQHEGQGLGWFPFSKLPEPMSEHDKLILSKVQKHFNE